MGQVWKQEHEWYVIVVDRHGSVPIGPYKNHREAEEVYHSTVDEYRHKTGVSVNIQKLIVA